MDAQPRFTRSRARAAPPEDNDPAPRQSLSLRQSILGPPPGEVADTPVTPPPTFVQPAWIIPRPNGEDALRARKAIRASRTRTQASNPADSPPFSLPPRNDPIAQVSHASSTARGSPMAQDSGHSDDEWFGVAGSDLYDPNDANATSGEEGSGPAHHSRSRSVFSSPDATDFRRGIPPVELSPSGEWIPPSPLSELPPHSLLTDSLFHLVALEDFVEVPPRVPSAAPTASEHRRRAPRGPFRDPALAPVPESSDNRPILQPAPRIHASRRAAAEQRGRSHHSEPHHHSRPRARTREASPGPDFGSHLRRSSRLLSPVAHYAPARFDVSSLRLGRNRDHPSSSPYALTYASHPQDLRISEQQVPVKNGRRFRDPRQGKISSSVPAAMLNQVNPLVISALRSGWPTFISLNYFSCRMSELGESSVSAAGETWDVDEAGQVKFKTKRLKELSFETISRRDWDSISKNMPRALMDYFIPPGECGIRPTSTRPMSLMLSMLTRSTPSGSRTWK
ncbi:hypothetical protein F5876DRAFT_84683 [Lentinula aff. lateritia]|uniref:Uncharacterized protein n=1 Tax=Lentinula aff. lateritia TaxID=2804960 RepID=A0ACC1TG69_9AGAR|nr:hypothetical protein F5876DRAFT_84683 [Lentinula aff. lateritia]